MKTKIGIIRDHSGSMQSYITGAINDYNLTVDSLKSSIDKNHKGLVTVVECGVAVNFRTINRVIIKDENVATLRNITSYYANGGSTPLLDAINLMIDTISEENEDSDTAYLIMVITDGGNNVHGEIAPQVASRIRHLQSTDKWTFAFRVPKGYGSYITNLGIPVGNVIEWEVTEKGLRQSTQVSTQATRAYFSDRTRGLTSSSSFYTDLSNVSISEVKRNLDDITDKVQILWVPEKYNKTEIRDFCIEHFGEYNIGSAYYQLNKSEKVQASKKICIKHKKSGKTYSGDDARDLLGLPADREVRVSPKDHGQYELFIQSTSTNRHLVGDTRLLYFK